jgi:hypothetical protein
MIPIAVPSVKEGSGFFIGPDVFRYCVCPDAVGPRPVVAGGLIAESFLTTEYCTPEFCNECS